MNETTQERLGVPREYLVKMLKDPKFYLENFCKIKVKKGGVEPFILKPAQVDLFNTLRRSNRVIILKSRQMGFSTAAAGFLYHKTITNPGTNTALIGYDANLTSELLEKIKMFISSTPADIRPTMHYNSKHEISFSKIDSKIIVLPSTDNVGRGYTIHNALCTELAFWERADEKMTSLENSVPEEGLIIVESTPNQVGNLFHKMWSTEDNGYAKKEYGWWWEYSSEQLKKIEKRMNNPQKFAQEYLMEFLTSGRPVFDMASVKAQRKNVLKVGDRVPGTEYSVELIDGFKVYKKPEEGKLYVMGADTSEGVQGGDYSVATILDRDTGEEAAMFRGLIAPDQFGKLLDTWGRKYNNALAVVEANNHGGTVLMVLKNNAYPCIYFRQQNYDTIANRASDRMGFLTNSKTKGILRDDLYAMLRDRGITIHSKETLDEMFTFVYDNNNDMNAQPGYHDDCIMSLAVAVQGFKVLYNGKLDQLDDSAYSHINYNSF